MEAKKNHFTEMMLHIFSTSNKGANSEKNEIIPGVDHSIVVSLVFEIGEFFIIFIVFKMQKKKYRIPAVSNSLDPDQARHFVGPDLGPNSLQSLSSADDTVGWNKSLFTLNEEESILL